MSTPQYKTILDLAVAAARTGQEFIEVVQDGVSKKMTLAEAIPAGIDGTNGVDGKSAYDVAVENGFVGNVTQWLLSLKGEDGAPGSGLNATLTGVNHTAAAKGSVASGTVTFDYNAGNWRSLTVGGALTIAFSNWPASGKLGSLSLKLDNGGAYTITWPTIRWLKSDGTYTTTFASAGVTLQSAGTDFLAFWSDDGGATIYGKVMR